MNGKIGFDIDGVLYNWHGVVYDWMLDYEKGFDIPYAEFWTDWIDKPERKQLANFLTKVPIFCTKLIMTDSMNKMLWDLSRDLEIFYITARPREVHFATKWWIKSSKVPYADNLIFAKDKVPHIIDNNIDFFVEDMTKHVLALRNYTNVILVKKPWNEVIQGEFPAVQSVLEIPELLGVYY
jgi:uncharacterized HAD superfamily protein